jgi:hypothetical protein
MKLFKSMAFYACVLCIMMMLSTDAFAFGKRCGGGLFGRRSQSTTVEYAGTTTSGCANGSCVQGPTQNQATYITQAGQSVPSDAPICVGGKCYTPEQYNKKFNAPTYSSQTVSSGPAWAPPAWKVVK